MNNWATDNLITKEIRDKVTNYAKFIEVQSYCDSVKLDGTFTIDDLAHIIAVFEKYSER